jgi:hypothetical protein
LVTMEGVYTSHSGSCEVLSEGRLPSFDVCKH